MRFNQGRRQTINALSIYYLLEGVTALFLQLPLTIFVVYYSQSAHLNPLQLVSLGTVFEATIFLFEIPTGVVADVYSRRVSIIIGVVLFGVGLMVQGLFPIYAVLLGAEILSGIGATFTSGATQAWITDEIGEQKAQSAFVRGAQLRLVGGIIGIVLSAGLATIALGLPFVLGGIGFLMLAGFLMIAMPENGFQRTPSTERESWHGLLATARAGFGLVRTRRILLLILVVGFIHSFHGEGFGYLWQRHILDAFTLPHLGPISGVAWFGVIGVGASLSGIGLAEWAQRVKFRHPARGLMVLYAGIVGAIWLFSAAQIFVVAIVAYWVVVGLNHAAEPLMLAWLNTHIESRTRATLFSIASQTGALGEILGGLPIGAIGTLASIPVALATCGVILATTLPILGWVERRERGMGTEVVEATGEG
ncbi:MAG: MFS transporter [Anaerolineae bacterium]|nr:MFS transporter [Anaerolineae bacterium]